MSEGIFKYAEYDHWKKLPGDQDHGSIPVYAHCKHGGPGCAEADVNFVLGVIMSAIEPTEYARLNLSVETAGGVDHGLASGGAVAGGASKGKQNGGEESSGWAVGVGGGGARSKKRKDIDYVRVGKFKSGDSFPEGSHFDLTSDDDEVAVPNPAVSQPSLQSVKESDAKASETEPPKQTLWMRLSSTEKFAMLEGIREKMAKEGWEIAQIQQVQNRKRASSHQFWAHINETQDTPTVRVFHGTSMRSVPSIVAQGLMLTKMANAVYGSGIYSSNDFATARHYASQRREYNSKLQHILVLDLHAGLVQCLTSDAQNYDFERLPGGHRYYNSRYVSWKHYYVAKEEAQLHLHAVLVLQQLEIVVEETEEMKEAARIHAAGAPVRAAVIAQETEKVKEAARIHAAGAPGRAAVINQEHAVYLEQEATAAKAKRKQARKDLHIAKRKLAKERR